MRLAFDIGFLHEGALIECVFRMNRDVLASADETRPPAPAILSF